MIDERTAKRPLRGRFAPSPTGRMHAGNIYSALLTWLMVKKTGGSLVLRIEDLDKSRSRAEYADQVQRDFELLGLTWDEGPFFQQDRDDAYQAAYDVLDGQGLVYPCFCTRADLKAASAPHAQDKWVYAGTCKHLSQAQVMAGWEACKQQGRPGPAFRLSVSEAVEPITIRDMLQGCFTQSLASDCGDFVIRRADGDFAYQLAVVVDDAEQGINFVSRGIDLLPSSPQQAYLQRLLGLPEVAYAHVPLLVAPDGRRLAKRDKDASLEMLLARYGSAPAVLGAIAHLCGLAQSDCPVAPEELLGEFSLEKARQLYGGVASIPFS